MDELPAIYTHYSNRTESLVEALVQVVAEPKGGPFSPEAIVVQGPGMAAYLTQNLASALGVWAHCDFSFPRRYIERCVNAVLGTPKDASPNVSEERLTWLVLAELERCLHDPAFSRLAHYLKNDERGVKRFQLARRLGTLFDRYVTFRPDMVRAWSRGESADVNDANQWQAHLWRRLEPHLAQRHFAAVESHWHERAAKLHTRPAGLPARVCVFGISSLPPPYVRLLAAASRWVQTHLFVFSPSDKDWWNSTSRVQWAQTIGAGLDPHALFMDLGHPLIASCGAVGGDFRRVMAETIERMGLSEYVDESYCTPLPTSLLARLQADLFMVDPQPVAPPAAPPKASRIRTPVAQMALPFATPSTVAAPWRGDASIAIHACHSPMREVEVCRDQLLALMTRPQDPIAPHEVVVMMPDVETYAPFVEAVFGEDPTSLTHIPFRIADRKLRADSPVVDAFFRALDLVDSRMTAPAVLDLITASAIEERLALKGADLDQLTDWIVSAGVRWGLDADHRRQHNQPADDQNTWRFGLDRLLLGYAMPSFGCSLFAGALPYDEIEGKQAADLGVFVGFLETLFFHVRHLEAPRTAGQWREDLLAFLSAIVGAGTDTDWQHQHIRQALADLETEAADAGFVGNVDLAVMRAWLQERVESALPERGFLAGGVTFCAMVPMRSIPFRVVCLLGLNDGAFPRPARTSEFDLVARGPLGPQPGDRDRRLDDRYLFLETVCAAREHLLITYTGQSVRDNAVRPPSVLVSELIEAFATPCTPREQIEEALVLRHPLQSFARRYFTNEDPRLFSYTHRFLHTAALSGRDLVLPPSFVRQALVAAPEVQIAFADLQRFWADPLQFFLQRRVRVDFPELGHDVPSREPTELNPLQSYEVGHRLLTGLGTQTAQDEQAFALLRATGLLPFGSVGQYYLDNGRQLAQSIASLAAPFMQSPQAPIHFDKRLSGDHRLVGTLDAMYMHGVVHKQFGKIKPKRQMRAWVSHLVLCWLSPQNVPSKTVVVGRAAKEGVAVLKFRRVENPLPVLEDLVALYQLGLQAPLRFQADAAFAFVGAGKPSRNTPMDRAIAEYADAVKFHSSWQRVAGDDQPPFESLVTLGPAFEELAHRVIEPMLAHRELVQGGEGQ